MKKWKIYQISGFIILCVLLNSLGQNLASRLSLPLWLDALGTVLSAYVGGSVCGALVGIAGNLIEYIVHHSTWMYSLTSIVLAVIVGMSARRKALSTFFGTMTVGAMAAIAAIIVSVPLDIFFHAGSTGNLWGDGVATFYHERGFPTLLSVLVGQFYLEFIDKQLTMMLTALVLLIASKLRGGKDDADKPKVEPEKALALALAVMLGCAAPMAARARAEAVPQERIDYNGYVQSVYSSGNGLPCGEANDIVQTSDGILWIGTYAGLYRYNGQEFRRMDTFDSVRNVNCLYVDDEGRLWIGTNDNGLSIAINEHIVNVIDQAGGLPADSVRSVIRGTDGYYYVGTSGSMQVFTLNNGLKVANTLREINSAEKSAADKLGNVAAIASDGRLFLLRKGQILSSLRLTRGTEIFRSCCFDPYGRLLVGSSGGHIYIYDISSDGFILLNVLTTKGLNNLKDLCYLNSGELFIAADDGVAYWDSKSVYHIVNTNAFNNSIDNMLQDYQGNLWFTSSRLGLLRMAPSSFKDIYSTVGMKGHVVNAVTKWQSCYYFGTDNGLDIVDESCRRQIRNNLTEELSGARIRCIAVDSRNCLWLCTYGQGVWEVEPDGTEHIYTGDNGGFGNRSRVSIELRDGTVVAGGNGGLSFIRDHAVTRTLGLADGLTNDTILTLSEMPDGKLLAGTNGGGIAVIEDGAITRMLTKQDGLSSGVILRTVPDDAGKGVFIVTSNGLCYMDAEGVVRTLDNFPYFNNYDIWVKDNGELFVMSSAGIYVVDREELLSGLDPLPFDLLDARRGLDSALTANSWTYYDGRGDLFLACDSGSFVIDTDEYASGAQTYRMMISSVQLDGVPQRVERSSPIEVSRGVARIELFPEILNYTIEDPNVGYFLEGFDANWTIMPRSSLSSIVYTNLPNGSYTLRLAVFDNARANILEERSYALTKRKEIQDNQWFVLYVALVPMLTVAWLTWFVMRRHIQRTLERQEQELAVVRHQVEMGNQTILAIAKAVDAKDVRTSQHSFRVSQYSVMIGKELGFSDEQCENLRKAALMHDIGKIGIPDSILNKPSRLTDEEYAIMKSHVTRGAEILKGFTLIDHVVEGALHHHERYDGRGYPSGMKGEEIPLYGRIIGVADAFDAMTANRVYRQQMDFEYVFNEMRNGCGTQFDPQCVDILLKLIEDGKINLNELYAQKNDKD